MTPRERAWASAAAIVPVTVAGLALLRCGCGVAAWTIEIATAVAYFAWITAKR